MATDTNSVTYRRIIASATTGFLAHGYHGYSMQACAETVGLQKGSLYHYVEDKLDLAHRVMQSLLDKAKRAIHTSEKLFRLREGLTFVLLPMRLWVANDEALQSCIRAYYTDWYFAFINRALENYDKAINDNALYPPGHHDFLQWLGFWVAQQIVFKSGGAKTPTGAGGFLH